MKLIYDEKQRIEDQKKYLLLKYSYMKDWPDEELISYAKSCLETFDRIDNDVILDLEALCNVKLP